MHAADKVALRKELKDRYTTAHLGLYVADAVRQIAEHEVFLGATSVLVYEPMPRLEIPFVGELIRRYPHKRWYVPEVVSEEEMIFIAIDPRAEHLESGSNKDEDDAALNMSAKMYRVSPKTCVIVPALALDSSGNRLGKGRGYYDRFLHAHPSLAVNTISIVPDFAFLDSVPVDVHDVRVQYPLCAHAQ